MMDATTMVVLAMIIAIMGKFIDKKQFSAQEVVYGFFAALFIAIINEGQPKLAKSFGALILISSLLINGVKIFGSVGKVNNKNTGVDLFGAGLDLAQKGLQGGLQKQGPGPGGNKNQR